jgi:hypothetical protein
MDFTPESKFVLYKMTVTYVDRVETEQLNYYKSSTEVLSTKTYFSF